MAEELEIGIGSGTPLGILYTGDLHGNVEKMKYIATLVKEYRAKRGEVLLLDSGDWSRGSPLCDQNHGMPMAEVMAYLRYDAVALGEADLSWGIRGLKKLLAAAGFPFLCANISGELPPGIAPFAMKTSGGLKVALLGVSPPVKLPERHMAMTSPEEALAGTLKKIAPEKPHLVILLSHLGLEKDRELAGAFPALDVIIGGHSHDRLDKPERVGNVLITHGGAYGEFLGSLELAVGTAVTLKGKE
ncbi:MAG: metallophosphatase [Candidatus Eremiobacteraeota bacterium]|nr:metallophosphatase [Candidatus Eremiobacteraeota bacterium]